MGVLLRCINLIIPKSPRPADYHTISRDDIGIYINDISIEYEKCDIKSCTMLIKLLEIYHNWMNEYRLNFFWTA